SLDSLETSIQKLLSELYPPFEATAPTLLSQLFQLIDSRYKGDALRCLLDFLVPAKHILDTVRQAACQALYSDLLFLCEGWPLCLRDQVVIHLAPINPLLLQPGDFYLKVAPFCDQSARIVICSLLEEEGLAVELVEETPIPETHCPCLFSSDWLKDINQGRHGAPLRQYLVATEQGIVRLPWEKVAVPEFVEVPQCVGSSMASVSPSFPPPQPSLTSSLPNFSKDSSHGLFSLPHTKESAPTQCNVTVQNSLSSTSAQPPAFTVETRISPAKHGIAVSLCLVGTSGTSSSKLVRLKDTDAEPKPIGWVSPGRDRTGRPIVELYGEHPGWRSAVTRQQICQMLLYFHLITREIREAGMTLIFDGRKTNPQPQLYQALMTLQEQSPQVLNSVVLLVSKDTSRGAERCPGIQVTVSSMKALLKLVEVSHLSSHLDGSLCHSHLDWLELHQKLFPFVSDLHEASGLLLSTIRKLEEPQRTDTVQNVQQCMMDQKTLMKDVLEESKLVSLQREGGSILARLRRESDLKYPHCDSLDAVDSVTSLYNHMEEQVHILVHNSNVSLEHLEYLKQLRGMEDHFTQQWYNVEGERHLLEAESVDESGDRLEQILNSFTGFLIEANQDRRHHAMSLVSEAEHLQRSGSSYSETETFKSFVQAFRSDLEKFLCRAEVCGRDLQIMVNVCDFCEQSLEKFQEIKVQASGLHGSRGMRVWNVAWLRCQEAQQQLQERIQDRRLQRVLEELVVTEREYVRSLNYILTHYFPLLDRQDIPQDLRGKRGIIFGNLEKLHNFHSHYFLPELEECQREPAMVARCFLRHSESFGLYALYSKNKPQSDALILHRRHDIFKQRKQQELGDMMDLSSYLLRPIQRISKYSLLLQDMLALAGSYRPKDMIQDRLLRPSVSTQNVCGPGAYVPDLTSGERERERAEIQSAADLVRFQMRHGNDLLTMDAIRDCDVNLKEQGQLIRQDEFTVFFRKKKCVRRVFLFEDLILFSKTKKTDVGNDVYVYKQSFKTSDIGMTHNSVVGSLCFEIWFRRRKSEDTYTLKATSMEGKKAWTTDLERILWDQAAHSRLRMQERVFMGMGRKPFMDIQPSDAAICDRAVNFPRPHSIGSGSTASTTLSQSSSSSGRGSLP
uniref:Uncharacterized protein n=1 Tax=Cynoglossus semilaevis TaxID=244447 RepID=A0A3P8WVS4_CYNSE